jgi:hypothetical protein
MLEVSYFTTLETTAHFYKLLELVSILDFFVHCTFSVVECHICMGKTYYLQLRARNAALTMETLLIFEIKT